MKKVLAIAAVASALFVGCLKTADNTPIITDCTPVPVATDEVTIKAFTTQDTSFTFTKDTSYIYYHIIDTGTGPSASLSSIIFFKYQAGLLNGTLLGQSSTPVQQALVNLIAGFQDMAPYLKKGTHIIMVIPSALAYGCQGISGSIPANAIIYYDVTITDIQ